MWSIDSVWTWILLEVVGVSIVRSQNRTSPYVTLSILDASIGLRQCCRASKLVCRILIPEAVGGPRLRYDARPWIIMMASSVYHADNVGRDDTLKWLHDFGWRKR
jgi:hypothetical protein